MSISRHLWLLRKHNGYYVSLMVLTVSSHARGGAATTQIDSTQYEEAVVQRVGQRSPLTGR